MPMTFRKIAKEKSRVLRAPTFDDALDELKTEFWRRKTEQGYFAQRDFLAWRNSSDPHKESVPIKFLVEYDPLPQDDDGIAARLYIYGWMVELDPQWMPEIAFGEGGEIEAFDELSRRPIADYPEPLRKVIEYIARSEDEGRRPAEGKTVAANSRCQSWLEELMRNGPPTKVKEEYRRQAQSKFKVSARSFNRAWSAACKTVENKDWTRPGRRSGK